MSGRLRVLVLVARPAVVLLTTLSALLGVAQGGGADDTLAAAGAVAVGAAFVLFSVLVNDLADERVDRVNLPADPRRPLVSGSATRRDLTVLAVASAVAATAGAAVVGAGALYVVLGGLALSAAYSARPVRLADRGAVAALVLPAGLLAVPYLVGVLSARPGLHAADLALLAGLYAGFAGRIVLKDFRDVRGDALFGKRTFLVRHGRRATCAVSAVSWLVAPLALLAVRGVTPELGAAWAALTVAALVLLRRLAYSGSPREDERLISALAIAGRGTVLVLITHLAVTDAGWPRAGYAATLAALAVVVLGQAVTMARHGAVTRTTVPAGWATAEVPG